MALFPLQSLWAQHYSVEELIRGFYAQYVEKSSEGRLEMDGLDMLMYAHEDIGRIRQSPDKPFLCFNEELHMAGDLKLPASVFVELYEEPGLESHLYWYSLRDSSCEGESDRLRVTLQRKYGSKQLPGGAVLVPAKWFSGELHALRNPFVYGNVPVSGSRCPTMKNIPRKRKRISGSFRSPKTAPAEDVPASCSLRHSLQVPSETGSSSSRFSRP